MCFVIIWEQTATCATYSINLFVFINQMKSVYSAVRTESLYNTDTFVKQPFRHCHTGDNVTILLWVNTNYEIRTMRGMEATEPGNCAFELSLFLQPWQLCIVVTKENIFSTTEPVYCCELQDSISLKSVASASWDALMGRSSWMRGSVRSASSRVFDAEVRVWRSFVR